MSDQSTEIMHYDPMQDGERHISDIEDVELRSRALELWGHTPDLSTDERRFLPATVIQIAEHFDDGDTDARTALSVASVLLNEGELNLGGQLDEAEINGIEEIVLILSKLGLDGVDVSTILGHLNINVSLGALDGLRELAEQLEDMLPSDIDDVKRELGIYEGHDKHHDEEDDVEADDDDYDEYDYSEPTPEVVVEPADTSIDEVHMLLGKLGMTGVSVIKIAQIYDLNPEEPDFLQEVIFALEHIAKAADEGDDIELEELRFDTQADVKTREPEDIAATLAEYHAAIAQLTEPEETAVPEYPEGTTDVVTDESGQKFII